MTEINDKSLMPFGAHKGKAMINVPADYLIYIYDNYDLHSNLKKYIKSNMYVLKKETKTK